jgi:glycerol-3-phosphate acyltransferase PlsY
MSIAVLVLGYLLGSIPFGLILAKLMGQGDIRKIGSGNIGATNALRTGNKKLAVLTLLGDLLKGTCAVLLAYALAPEVAEFAGLLAVLGHVFPVWLKFKGGKGVATALGVLLALLPLVFVAVVATWLTTFKLSRISSLSALVAFALAPIFGFFTENMRADLIVLLIAIIIFATHRANINRLIRGEEKAFKK